MFVIKKRTLVVVSVLVATAFTFIFCFSALNNISIGEASVSGIKIVIDAGHGGIDNGVSGIKTGVKESELNLIITKKIEKYITDSGMSAVLTRSSSAGLYGVATGSLKRKDMQKRKKTILDAEPTLVVSIHMNKFGQSSRRGAQVFYKDGHEQSKLLAESIQSSFNSMENVARKSNPLTGDYYILNCSEYPSVIVECGFLSNPEDEALLITEEYQDSVAYAVFKGIVAYLSESSFNLNDELSN